MQQPKQNEGNEELCQSDHAAVAPGCGFGIGKTGSGIEKAWREQGKVQSSGKAAEAQTQFWGKRKKEKQ